jgi:hypothetical protein
MSTDVSEEHIASIFRVRNQRESRWQEAEPPLHNHRCENLKSYISVLKFMFSFMCIREINLAGRTHSRSGSVGG